MIKALKKCVCCSAALLHLLYGRAALGDDFALALSHAAIERTQHAIIYNGAYFSMGYPGGDIPAHFGVCTDVVIRSFRALKIDLQQKVHEDMLQHFDLYPSKRIWGLTAPDANIDHRRVPNLQTFFSLHGHALTISDKPSEYRAGDIVTWQLPGNLPHIGIVSDKLADGGTTPMIVHNIGGGPRLENRLFSYKISGHYRFISQQ
ncbi:MAG: hypothetical protein ACI9Y1_000853 [Lentisphaeria bacterium]|jgi:uncharacterized protein YijF (DUF1287 family)